MRRVKELGRASWRGTEKRAREEIGKEGAGKRQRMEAATTTAPFAAFFMKQQQERDKKQQHQGGGAGVLPKVSLGVADPSTQYLQDPLRAPVVATAREFFRKNGVKGFDVKLGNKTEYRTCAKLCVRGTPPVIGLFEPGSHHVTRIEGSAAHHPSINLAIQRLEEMFSTFPMKGYDGVNPGGLSYIALNVQTLTRQVQVVFVFNEKSRSKKDNTALADRMVRSGDSFWHSIWIHCHPASRHDNAIFGISNATWECLHGNEDDILSEILPISDEEGFENPPTLYFHPQCFRQANLAMFGEIVTEIRKHILSDPNSTRKPKAVELYGGVGTIGLNLHDKIRSLVCSDENPHNKECFEKSVESIEMEGKFRYEMKSASQMVSDGKLKRANIVIVDPPRKGMEKDVVDAILQHARNDKLRTLIYVSCGFKAFVRDFALLKTDFKVKFARGYLMFPGSDHIETLCVFERKPLEDDSTKV